MSTTTTTTTPSDADIRIVMNQTTYSEQESADLLRQYETPEAVIRRYMGIERPVQQRNTPIPKSQLNQAMFAQFRRQLDLSKYRERNPANEDEIAQAMYDEHMKKKEREEEREREREEESPSSA